MAALPLALPGAATRPYRQASILQSCCRQAPPGGVAEPRDVQVRHHSTNTNWAYARSIKAGRSRWQPALVLHCADQDTEQHTEAGLASSKDSPEHRGLGVNTALWLLAAYQGLISPLIPKSCRFVPTCSNYSRQAVVKYGVAKGTILTAWRVLRCNPWGGQGYDPPAWPPVGF